MHNLRYLLFFLFIWICTSYIAKKASHCDEILTYIYEHLPSCGDLQEVKGQFVYVKVDDQYIYRLQEFIKEDGYEVPPYFGSPDLVGAHISVIYPEEMKRYGIFDIAELGEKICFQIKGCEIIHPPHWKNVDLVYIITLNAPKLDQLRGKYGLSKRKYDFHITIGIKKAGVQAA
jgi:hypothetical protein